MKRILAFFVMAALFVCLSLPALADYDPDTDYYELMIDAAAAGDQKAGEAAESSRNEKIDALHREEKKISYDELVLLAKIIHSEAGSDWLSMEWKMAVGEVLLNRVESPEFPDTLEECVFQPGQYVSRDNSYFRSLRPYRSCAEAAARLLSGERVLDEPSVVFQAEGRQGSGVFREFRDSYYGSTYLCYSSYPELYE